MKVLVIGQGAREHALAAAMKRSASVSEVYVAPGNPAMQDVATLVTIEATDVEALKAWALQSRIDLTVVGPEASLMAGVVDAFEAAGLVIFGPNQKAAQLEGSKAFAKALMKEYHIPTARYEIVESLAEATSALARFGYPLVIKQNGLCAGKGVVIVHDMEEAQRALEAIYAEESRAIVVIEAFLTGYEVSLMVVTDGTDYVVLPTAQDHKRRFEGDTGPNTGGMGAYSPAVPWDEALQRKACQTIIEPTLAALKLEGIAFKGVLYAGLMVVAGTPYVLEFNTRFGDPEAQVVLGRLQGDVAQVLRHAATGSLVQAHLEVDPRPMVCVVLASPGYPESCQVGQRVSWPATLPEPIAIYGAALKDEHTHWVSAGGRVVSVCAKASTLPLAIEQVYEHVPLVQWDQKCFRHDIGQRALTFLQAKE